MLSITKKRSILIMTLNELAGVLGLSVSAVSKAFNGAPDVGEETRERVFKAAKQYGCFEKYYKGHRNRKVVAILIPAAEREFCSGLCGALERLLDKHGIDTIVGITRYDSSHTARMFSDFAYRMQVDGVIVLGFAEKIKNPDEIPLVVLMCDPPAAANSDRVRFYQTAAIFELIGKIKDYGHKKIGFIGEVYTESKLDMFKQAMRHHGLTVKSKYIVSDTKERSAVAGEIGMQRLIDSGDVPSVIFTAYDQIAFGAMKRAMQCGYRIPQDISFAGFDNELITSYLDVPLTSIGFNFDDACEKIVDLLMKRMEDKHYRSEETIFVPYEIYIRESLRNLKG